MRRDKNGTAFARRQWTRISVRHRLRHGVNDQQVRILFEIGRIINYEC